MDGSILRELLLQTPTVALLLIILILDRRDHARVMAAMRDENIKLQQAVIDHMNREGE